MDKTQRRLFVVMGIIFSLPPIDFDRCRTRAGHAG